MGLCSGCAKMFLVLLNIIFAVVGLGMMGAGIYAMTQFSKFADYGIPMTGFGGVAGMGAIVCIFSLLGAYGACKATQGGCARCALRLYIIFVGLAVLGQLAFGAAIMVFSSQIVSGNTACPDGTEGINGAKCKLQEGMVTTISDFVDCTWVGCCDKALPNKSLNQSKTFCSAKFKDAVPNAKLCDETLKKIDGLINCNAVDSKAYRADFYKFFSANLPIVGGAVIGFGVVQLLALVASCVVIWQNRDELKFDAVA